MKVVIRFVNMTFAMIFVFGTIWIVTQDTASAHCDTLDGPVVIEAGVALKKGDVTPVLKWVKKAHEDEIKTVCAGTASVPRGHRAPGAGADVLCKCPQRSNQTDGQHATQAFRSPCNITPQRHRSLSA